MQSQDHLAENLRTLCEQAGTISDMCRKIGINRQQFNKYLTGAHMPSRSSLRLIAGFFGLNPDVLMSNPPDFRSIMEGGHFHIFRNMINAPKTLRFLNEVVSLQSTQLEELTGIYERYHYSSIYKGSIVRSVFCVYESNGLLQHYYVERFPDRDRPGKFDCHFNYHGLSFYIANRLFSIDFETIQKNEMTFSNMAAINRNAKRYIFGVSSGVAATMMRQPVAVKVAMCQVDKGLIKRRHIHRATVLSPTDESIPREILIYLNAGESSIDSG